MKRLLAVIICLALLAGAAAALAEGTSDQSRGKVTAGSLSVGDTLYFGHFEQDDHGITGLEAIEWQVLEALDDRVLVVSRCALDYLRFSNVSLSGPYLWAEVSLRDWLNGEFLQTAFTGEEQTAILLADVKNGADQCCYDVDGGPDTQDRVFLLSWAEVERLFPEEGERGCAPTSYAMAKGCKVDAETGCCHWWLRSQGPLEGYVGQVSANLGPDYGAANSFEAGVRPALWLDATAEVDTEPESVGDMTAEAGDIASPDALPGCDWMGYRLTPMYCDISRDNFIRVRVACDGAPEALLLEHMDAFRLTDESNGTSEAPDELLSLGHRLDQRSDGTAQYIDLYFDVAPFADAEEAASLAIALDDSGTLYTVPNVKFDSSRCAFRTSDGGYAIELFSEAAADEIWARAVKLFNGADIRLVLGQSFYEGPKHTTGTKFLESFDFASLDLTTSMDLSDYRKSDCLVALNMLGEADRLREFPNVKRFSFRLSPSRQDFPEFDALPGLETLDITLLTNGDDAADIRRTNSRPPDISPTLKKLNLHTDGGSPLTGDVDFRVWLEAQRDACPDLIVNGAEARSLDLTEGLDEQGRDAVLRTADDQAMMALYDAAVVQRTMPAGDGAAPGEQMVVLVVRPYGGIVCASTDESPEYAFDALPAGRMSPTLAGADALAVIYPVLEVVGHYGVMDANSCETRLAVIDIAGQRLISDESIATRSPKGSITLGVDDNYGDYEVELALEALAEKLG